MDLKKFKLNLENILGKKLDKLNKDFISYKFELDKAKNQLHEINKFIEGKNKYSRHSTAIVLSDPKDKQLNSRQQSTNLIKPIKKLDVNNLNSNKKQPEPNIDLIIPKKKIPETIIEENHKVINVRVFLPTKTPEKKAKRVVIPKAPLSHINSQLQDIENNCLPSLLNACTDFNISLGAKSAFDIIKAMSADKFKLPENPDIKIIWAMGLIYRLLGEDFAVDDDSSKEKVQNFLQECLNSNNITEFLTQTVRQFDFSDSNIDLVEEYITGKEDLLSPQIYTQISQLCGLMMVSLREAVVYCGLVKGKSPLWRTYKRLLHKKSILESQICN